MIDLIGGPDRDRTDDLFHAMEARSQLRHRPTLRGGDNLFSLAGLAVSSNREFAGGGGVFRRAER